MGVKKALPLTRVVKEAEEGKGELTLETRHEAGVDDGNGTSSF